MTESKGDYFPERLIVFRVIIKDILHAFLFVPRGLKKGAFLMLYLDFSAQPCFYGDLLAKVHS